MITKLKCSFIQMENPTGKSFSLFLAKVMWTHSKKWKKWFYYFCHSLLYFLSSKVSNNIPTSTREINMITAIILLPQMSSCKIHLINTHIQNFTEKVSFCLSSMESLNPLNSLYAIRSLRSWLLQVQLNSVCWILNIYQDTLFSIYNPISLLQEPLNWMWVNVSTYTNVYQKYLQRNANQN